MTSKHVGFFCHAAAAAVWVAVLIPGSANAGPPFRTDDPEPVDYMHYEFYTPFFTGTHVRGDTSGVGPAFELNYGLIPNGQLHIVAPLAFDSPAGGAKQFGYGDTELGFKYRFIQEDEKGVRPQVGVFPFLELTTGNESQGLGAGHLRVYLPLWVQKSFGDWTTYGGGGYWINHGNDTDDKDFWFFGWLLQRKITDKLTLGGEIFHQTADTINGKDSTGFNIGGFYNIDEHNHILFSAGRGFQNASESNLYSWYIAYQITN
jgi:subtilisin family serine protease